MTAGKKGGKRPEGVIPSVHRNLLDLPDTSELMVWLGHSSLFLQTGGARVLVDPIFGNHLPEGAILRPFKGTRVFSADDVPPVDALVITHCHWDHLDYHSVKALKDKAGMVICPLGVGEFFEYWGYPPEKIHELDWGDVCPVKDEVTLKALPARHNSIRYSGRDRTFWMSFMLSGASTIFVSGDGGIGPHFARIAAEFPEIDLAVMENGQYDSRMGSEHTRPEELRREIEILAPRLVFTCHNSKYSLSDHPWTEPLELIYLYALEKGIGLLTPLMGEIVDIGEGVPHTMTPWWRSVDGDVVE